MTTILVLLLWGLDTAGAGVGPYRTALEAMGLSFGSDFVERDPKASLRERVCYFQEYLDDLKVKTQLSFRWVEHDFGSRSEKDRAAIMQRINSRNVDHSSEPLIENYRWAIQSQPWFKKMPCAVIAELGAEKGTSRAPAECAERFREQQLKERLFSAGFIESRIKLHLPKVKDPPFGLDRMLARSLELSDPISALSVMLAGDVGFEGNSPKAEHFGPPVGPYACSGGALTPRDGPLVSTSFYYWHDFGGETDGRKRREWESVFTVTPENVSNISYREPNWYSNEFRSMGRTGINTAFLVYRGGPYGVFDYSDAGLPPLVRGIRSQSDVPAVALLIDGFLFYGRGNSSGRRLDISSQKSIRLLAATARDFYSLIPAPLRAHKNGRLLVGFKNLSQASRVDGVALVEFRKEFAKTFGAEPYLFFPRQELLDYVRNSNPKSIETSVEKLSIGTLTPQVIGALFQENYIRGRLPSKNSELADYFFKQIIVPPLGYTPTHGYWKNSIDGAPKQLIAQLAARSAFPLALRHRERLSGTPSKYSINMAPEDQKLEFLEAMAQRYADLASPIKDWALALDLLGRCPLKDESIKVTSMLSTWEPAKAATYLMATKSGLRQYMTAWLVDTVMAPKGVVDEEVFWEGHPCGVTGGVATAFPGRNDRALARLAKHEPIHIDRKNGEHFQNMFESMLERSATPSSIHIESWNGYHDGTAIAATLEFGTKYETLTREWLTRIHAKGKRPISVVRKPERVDRAPASINKNRRK